MKKKLEAVSMAAVNQVKTMVDGKNIIWAIDTSVNKAFLDRQVG